MWVCIIKYPYEILLCKHDSSTFIVEKFNFFFFQTWSDIKVLIFFISKTETGLKKVKILILIVETVSESTDFPVIKLNEYTFLQSQ